MGIILYRDPQTQAFMPLSGGGPPIGVIMPYAGTVAPPGWHICDGSVHGSTALAAVIGSPNTPNLQDRFVVGAGAVGYAAGTTGGAATVTLTAAQSGMPSHSHTASSGGDSANHTHTLTTSSSGGHIHSNVAGNFIDTSDLSNNSGPDNVILNSTWAATTSTVGNHAHGGTTGNPSGNHTHAVSVGAFAAANATLPHENRPPYYAIVFIIRKA